MEHVGAESRRIPHEANALQSSATPERPVADGGDAVGEGYARQTSAPPEGQFADGGDAAGEGHGRQSTAMIERQFADGSDREVVDGGWDDQVAGGFWVGAGDGDGVSRGGI